MTAKRGEQAAGELLGLLADGQFHSGEALGQRLGCSRAYLWKLIGKLRESGFAIDAVSGRGYRLAFPIEFLDASAIRARVGDDIDCTIEVVDEVGSTNQELLDQARGLVRPKALLAERQSAGRGRWGRRWLTPVGGGLALSLAWPTVGPAERLAGLSLGIGVALAEALEAEGLGSIRLKWPNDLVCEGHKLGGILIELVGEPAGPLKAVVGVGLNIFLPAATRAEIPQPVADLFSLLGEQAFERNRLAALLIERLLAACHAFERKGLAEFAERWARYDALQGQRVVLNLPSGAVEGIMRGVDAHGALILQQSDGTQSYFTGEAQLKVRQ